MRISLWQPTPLLEVSVPSAEVGDHGRWRHIAYTVKVDLHAFT
jgi:hypothetical protein